MPRVTFVKKARKAIKAYDIKKGDSYYHWSFRRGGKRISKTHPRPSQLTQSEYFGAVYSSLENLEDVVKKVDGLVAAGTAKAEDLGTVAAALRELQETFDEQRDSCEEKRSNMEEKFPSGCPSMETMDERISQCEELGPASEDAAVEVEGIIDDLPHMMLPAVWTFGEGRERPDLTNKVLIGIDMDASGKRSGLDVICGLSPKLKKGMFYLCVMGKYDITLPELPPPAPKVRKKKGALPPPAPHVTYTPDRKIMEDAWASVKELVEGVQENASGM